MLVFQTSPVPDDHRSMMGNAVPPRQLRQATRCTLPSADETLQYRGATRDRTSNDPPERDRCDSHGTIEVSCGAYVSLSIGGRRTDEDPCPCALPPTRGLTSGQ